MDSEHLIAVNVTFPADVDSDFYVDHQEEETYLETLARVIDHVDTLRGHPVDLDLSCLVVYIDGVKVEDHDAQAPLEESSTLSVTGTPQIEMVAIFLAGALSVSLATVTIASTLIYIAATVIVLGALAGLNMAIGAIFGPSSAELQGAGTASPAHRLSGGGNKVSPFGAIPRVYGTWDFYPPMAARPYTEIAGDQQYVRQALNWGYGDLDLGAIKLGTTDLSSYDEVQQDTQHLTGTPAALTWYPGDVVDLSVNLTLNPDLTLIPGTPDPAVDPPTYDGIGQWNTRTTAAGCIEIAVDVLFPQGLVHFAADGDWAVASVRLDAEYRISGSSDPWVAMNSFIPAKKTRDAFFITLSAWGLTPETYDVRFRRQDNDGAQRYPSKYGGTRSEQGSRADTINWVSLKSYQEGFPVLQPDITVSSMRVKASDQLSGTMEELHAVVTSRLATVVAGVYTPSPTVPTSNPAWIGLDILVGTANPKPRSTAQVDLDNFEEFATFCATEGFEFNHPFDYLGENVFEAFQQAVRAGRGSLAFYGDKVGVVWDAVKPAPVQLFTRRNISGYKETKVYGEQVDAVRVNFRNSAQGYQTDETIIYNSGKNAGNAVSFETMDVKGSVTAGEVWKQVRYEQLQAQFRPSVVTLDVDLEVVACKRGDLVRVQQPYKNSARVRKLQTDGGGNITKVWLDEWLDYAAATLYGATIRSNTGAFVDFDVDSPFGGLTDVTSDAVAPSSPLAPGSVAIGDLLAFGIRGDIYRDMVVLKVGNSQDLTATLECVDHAPQIFTTLAGETAPAHTTHITTPTGLFNTPPPAPQILQIQRELLTRQDGSASMSLLLSLAPGVYTSSNGAPTTSYKIQYRQTTTSDPVPGAWVTAPLASSQDGLVRLPNFTALDGFDIRVYAVSSYGSVSAATLSTGHLVYGDAPTPTGFSMSPDLTATSVGNHASAAFAWFENSDRLAHSWRLQVALDDPANVILDTTTLVPQYTLPDALVGTYYVRLWAISVLGAASLPHTETVLYDPLIPIAPLRPSGLEVLGSLNVGQGSDVTFDTTDVVVQWRKSNGVRVVGEVGNPTNPLLKDFVVEVLDDAGVVVRQETTVQHTYNYTNAKNAADHGGRADRSPTIRVRMRDIDDNLSKSATITPYNAPPAVVSNILMGRAIQRVIANFDTPAEQDYDGVLIWGHGTDPTVPAVAANILYEGRTGAPVMFDLPAASGTYYIRMAAFDVFGKDSADLNISSVFTVPYAGLDAGSVDTVALAVDAASAMYEATDEDFALFTATTADNTWIDVVEIGVVTVLGNGGADNPVLINGVIDAKVQTIFEAGPVQTYAASAGFNPVFEYRIVKDLGLAGEEVVYPASGTETKTTISSAGYIVGGVVATSILMSPGAYKMTLQARWTLSYYVEGTAWMVESVPSPGTILSAKGLGTHWRDWLAQGYNPSTGNYAVMEFRIPSHSAAWHYFLSGAQDSIQFVTPFAGTGGSTPGAAYEVRWGATAGPVPHPVIDVVQASLNVTEKRA